MEAKIIFINTSVAQTNTYYLHDLLSIWFIIIK